MAEAASTESELSGDLWGGFAAALVALPSAIAFGVAIYTPLGAERGAAGAVAGVLGAVALGLIAPALGGAPRLITAPCAPAAAVMSALAADLATRGLAPDLAIASMVAVAALSGVLQLGFGLLGAGRLIKYIPYPVVSGYLSGVAILIFLKQLPGLLGLRGGQPLGHALAAPSSVSWSSVAVGVVTIAAMAGAPLVTRRIPPPVIGLAGGLAAYFGLAARDSSLLTTVDNPLVVGPIGGGGGSVFAELPTRLLALPQIPGALVADLVAAAATLSVLLSMDTLKTGVVVDALTRSRHDSNRELRGQGAANLASALLGGVPGAGTMGATLVSVSSGGRTRRAGLVAGATSLVAYVALSGLIAWIPRAALAGILLVVAFRMFDRASLKLLRSRTTLLDFLVVLAVVVVAVGVGLVTAAGVGVALATVLFVREQIRGTVVRRRASGEQIRSKQQRLPQELDVLAEHGSELTVVWLSGDLFFGTTDQLFSELSRDLTERRYVVLELSRVQSLDYTAAHLLEQMEDQLGSHGGHLLYAGLRRGSPAGRELIRYLD
ncbi:MAG: SulP family inorganic anion transporter, partial [Deltaproteobacteria bacterium]|nr:SulP family inorganic anion transporter [Deltaproteobacteria bacterium]